MTSARPLLSVVIPVYNERTTLRPIVVRVQGVDVAKEIVLVDDGSTDGTRDLLPALAKELTKQGTEVRVVLQDRNRGKGAAIRRGFEEARGEYVVIQDADLEYDPEDYPRLLAPLLEGKADVVFGSRFLDGRNRIRPLYRFANWVLTTWSNVLTWRRLTDVWTCYKVYRREDLVRLVLKEDRFGIEAEITAKTIKAGWTIVEVPVGYHPRTHAEGKKIKLGDAIQGMWATLRHSFTPKRRALKP